MHTQHKDATLIRVFVPKAGGKQGEGFVAGFAVQHYAGEVSDTAEAATPAPLHPPLHHPCTTLRPPLDPLYAAVPFPPSLPPPCNR